jgi:predicted permease
MGLSVLRDAFGAAGFVQGVVYFAVATLTVATLGRAAARGSWDSRTLFGSPIAWGMAAALALVSVPWTPPKFVLDTTTLLGHLVVPVMLIAAGVALGRATRIELRQGLPSGIVRLAIGLTAGIAVAEGLGLDGLIRAVVILETAMPVAFLWTIYTKDAWSSFAGSLLVGLLALPFLAAWLI